MTFLLRTCTTRRALIRPYLFLFWSPSLSPKRLRRGTKFEINRIYAAREAKREQNLSYTLWRLLVVIPSCRCLGSAKCCALSRAQAWNLVGCSLPMDGCSTDVLVALIVLVKPATRTQISCHDVMALGPRPLRLSCLKILPHFVLSIPLRVPQGGRTSRHLLQVPFLYRTSRHLI